MKKLFLLVGVSFFLSACGAATEKISGETKPGGETKSVAGGKPQAGDAVVFKASAIAYNEGKVERVEGGKYEIRSGNNIAKADAADVYALPKTGAKAEVKAGDYVAASTGDIYWTGGEVKSATDDLVEIEKAAGGKINVAPDKILKVSPTAVADIKQHIAAKAFEDAGKSKKPILPKGWKPKKGEKIAAQWSFGSWHAAIVRNVNANNLDITWQNGWRDATIASDKAAPYPTAASPLPQVNDYVIVRPPSDSEAWKFAIVTAIGGREAEVKFADGKTQKVRNSDFIAMS